MNDAAPRSCFLIALISFVELVLSMVKSLDVAFAPCRAWVRAYFASPTAFAPFLPNRFARLAIPARIFLFLCFDRLVFSI
jgi:hypothetical protein